MAASNDWYPRDPVELTVFYENLAVTLPEVAVRLEIDEETLERVRRNANWLIYWTQKRSEIENHGKALTAYYQHVAWGNGKGEKAHAPLISPSEPPPEVPVGIDSFTRNLRRRILSHPNYTLIEGALLGLAKTTTSLNETNVNAEFSTEKISPTMLRVKFRKHRMDAFRLEIRQRGSENWTPLAYFTASSAELEIEPSEPGAVEEIHLRGVLMRKNEVVGNPAYVTAIIGGAL